MGKRRQWLIEKRENKGFTQKQFADLCGVAVQTISNIEVGNRRPSGKLGIKMAKELDFDMSLFYEDEEVTV